MGRFLRTLRSDVQSSDTLELKPNLADILNKTTQHEEEEKLRTEILQNQINKLSADHPKTLRTKLADLAFALYNQDKYEDAEKLYKAILQAQTEEEGPNHPETMATKRNLLFVLYAKGEYEKAEKLRQDLFQTQTNSSSHGYLHTLPTKSFVLTNNEGQNHEDTLVTRHNLAYDLYQQGKYEEAEKLFRDVLQMENKILGLNHPSTHTTKRNLARVLVKLGKYDEAQNIFEDVLQTQIKMLGPYHPDTLVTKHSLALFLSNQSKYEEGQLTQDVFPKLRPTDFETVKIMKAQLWNNILQNVIIKILRPKIKVNAGNKMKLSQSFGQLEKIAEAA